ncbi:MAG: hypothetical protein IPM29_02730 [Planctomycetes bacterium]|nr:hypothetical protein [Planctomycetota bacterium]
MRTARAWYGLLMGVSAVVGVHHATSPHPRILGLDDRLELRGAQLLGSGRLEAASPELTVAIDLDRDGTPDRVLRPDARGRFVEAIPARDLGLTGDAPRQIEVLVFGASDEPLLRHDIEVVHGAASAPTDALADASSGEVPTAGCRCNALGSGAFAFGNGLDSGDEPCVDGVSLVDGSTILELPVVALESVGLHLEVSLYHRTNVDYSGPVGNAISHTYLSSITQVAADRAIYVSPRLEVFDIVLAQGNWVLPEGFFASLERNTLTQRWVMTHYTGLRYEFLLGGEELPGPLLGISDANGNTLSLACGPSGELRTVRDDVGQQLTSTTTAPVVSARSPIRSAARGRSATPAAC